MPPLFPRLSLLLGSALLAACAQMPVIDPQKIAPPKSVAIVDIPPLRHVAWLGVYVSPYEHFRPTQDVFFIEQPAVAAKLPTQDGAGDRAARSVVMGNPGMSPGQAGTAGVVGGLIDLSARETMKRATGYHEEVLRQVPGTDFRRDFMASLRAALDARGYRTLMLDEEAPQLPRLRWPAPGGNERVRELPARPLEASPPVDADVVMQVSPVAMHMAPGALNAYSPQVSVAVALYGGRTREFIGMQVFQADLSAGPNPAQSYHTYDGLVADLPRVVPMLRAGLLSLVPKVVATLPAPAR